MGFIAGGYYTAEFKTRRCEDEPWKLCRRARLRCIRKSKHSGRQKARQDSVASRQSPKFKRKLSIQDLPSELIQQIFVFSGNHELYVVSKFFYACLKPTTFLLHRFILGNFYLDLNHDLNPQGNQGIPVLHGLNTRVFENPRFVAFLNENPGLLSTVGHISDHTELHKTNLERRTLFREGNLVGLGARHKEVEKQDFPTVFYRNVELYLQNDIQMKPVIYNQLILELFAHYEIKQPYYLMENVIHWVFEENEGKYNINHLFYALILICHISPSLPSNAVDNNGPLIELLNELFAVSAGKELCEILLLDEYAELDKVNDRKVTIINKFIKKFYKGEDKKAALLSQDVLWNTLVQLKNKEVIQIIIQHGGQPSFSVIQ